jgi:hypothetical protein
MSIKLICSRVADGFIPAEKIVYIEGADGALEEVTVASKSLIGDRLEASEIWRTKGTVLVELPRESASGRWRVWVKESSIGV